MMVNDIFEHWLYFQINKYLRREDLGNNTMLGKIILYVHVHISIHACCAMFTYIVYMYYSCHDGARGEAEL